MGKKGREKQTAMGQPDQPQRLEGEAKRVIEALGTVCSASAVHRFDTEEDVVRRVVLKVNPTVYGQFLVMAIMRSDVRYEGVVNQQHRRVDWCETPNCTCNRFIAVPSPLEAGFTIDD